MTDLRDIRTVDYTIRMKVYFDYQLRGKEAADWIINGRLYPLHRAGFFLKVNVNQSAF